MVDKALFCLKQSSKNHILANIMGCHSSLKCITQPFPRPSLRQLNISCGYYTQYSSSKSENNSRSAHTTKCGNLCLSNVKYGFWEWCVGLNPLATVFFSLVFFSCLCLLVLSEIPVMGSASHFQLPWSIKTKAVLLKCRKNTVLKVLSSPALRTVAHKSLTSGLR